MSCVSPRGRCRPHLLGLVLHLAHGRLAVAAGHGAEGTTHVDVELPEVAGVRQIYDLPVPAGAGPGETGGRRGGGG